MVAAAGDAPFADGLALRQGGAVGWRVVSKSYVFIRFAFGALFGEEMQRKD